MREIKFRAWFKGDEKNGPGWIQGFNMMNFHDYFTKGIEPMLQRYDRYWGKDQYVLMQYTGLKDKNGTEIYEGDILKRHDYEKPEHFVMYKDGGFGIRNIKHSIGHVLNPFTNMNLDYWEVSGNIHQHPELLTPKQ